MAHRYFLMPVVIWRPDPFLFRLLYMHMFLCFLFCVVYFGRTQPGSLFRPISNQKKIPGNLDDFSRNDSASTFDKEALFSYFPHTAVPFKIFVTSATGIWYLLDIVFLSLDTSYSARISWIVQDDSIGAFIYFSIFLSSVICQHYDKTRQKSQTKKAQRSAMPFLKSRR